MRGGLTFREGHYICEAIAETDLLVSLDLMVCLQLSSELLSLTRRMFSGSQPKLGRFSFRSRYRRSRTLSGPIRSRRDTSIDAVDS